MSKEILINQLFAGKYLEEGENIGHEVINLFKDDNGYNNLYITPSGSVSGHDIEAVFFVRNTSKRTTVEVIGVAMDINLISEDEVREIRYAGVPLDRIFNSNMYHGKADISTQHVTFRAKNLYIPSRPVFITLDNDFTSEEYTLHLESNKKVIIPQGMRMYYSEENDSVAITQLRDLTENKELWNCDSTTKKLYPEGSMHTQESTFLEVIKKEDDENIFSNLFGYFFEYSHRGFQKFATEVLGITNMSLMFDLYRETKYRTDIWIESEDDIIVIENKINSGINGIKDDTSQLDKYYKEAEKEAKNNSKKTHYYIFAPDYANLDLTKYDVKSSYKMIEYSKIYSFFIKEAEEYIADRIFPDFIRGLKRHTLSLPELQFDTMRSRLLRKINLLQQYNYKQDIVPAKSAGKKITMNDIADEIERIILASDGRIKISPMEFILKVCKEKYGINSPNKEIDSADALNIYFGIMDLLQEKSKNKTSLFSMRLAPAKEERWGEPYVFEYIFKKR